jgi:hypothetical protein
MFIIDGDNMAWQRAKSKAAETRPEVQVKAAGVYRVEGSTPGHFYNVAIVADGQNTVVDCNCLAGTHDKPCYHGAAALTQHLAFVGAPVAPAQSKHLKHLNSDLRHIMRLAEQVEGNYELVEAIFRTARAAHDSLSEYELELQPAADEMVAA